MGDSTWPYKVMHYSPPVGEAASGWEGKDWVGL